MKNILFKNKNKIFFCDFVDITNVSESYKGVISIIDKKHQTVKISTYAQYLKDGFTLNDQIRIKAEHNGKEYSITGIITEKVISLSESCLIVKISTSKEIDDIREFKRFNYECSVTVNLSSDESILATLQDISSGGVLISSKYLINTLDNIDMSIEAFQGKKISFKGHITRQVHKGNIHNYSIKIEDITPENTELLNELIMFLSVNYI